MNAPYVPIIWQISALNNRLKAGNTLEKSDYKMVVPLHTLENIIVSCDQTPNDIFYKRHRYSGGRNEFIQALNRVSIALLKPIYGELKQCPSAEIGAGLIERIIETIHQAELPSTNPPTQKLLQLLGEEREDQFSKVVSDYATTYAKNHLREVVNDRQITHIPEDSPFSSTEDPLNCLNYIFTQASDYQFKCIATAIELSGKDFEDKQWTSGLLIGKYAAPDFSL